ncbi:hypothetical protein [Halobellus sp. Atlit-38R]|uniref:hypothetical protein n=1 Tax=Halobellus sp. Atlit-38R TaxID=2282131 RepID=UPI0011C3CED5|nr:hypothetical protein [Halobellus sp. Atlit-38R]
MVEYEQCRYTHEISDEGTDVEIFEHTDASEWSCHHPSGDDSKYCLFQIEFSLSGRLRICRRVLWARNSCRVVSQHASDTVGQNDVEIIGTPWVPI